MSREVQTFDWWFTRLLKFIPWEAAAAYTAIFLLLPEGEELLLLPSFLVLLAASAFYLRSYLGVKDGTQLAIMSAAFFLYGIALPKDRLSEYLIGSSPTLREFFESPWPSVLVILFVAVCALVFRKKSTDLEGKLKPEPE